MRPEITSRPTPPHVLQQLPAGPETIEPDLSCGEFPLRHSDLPAQHDATLIVAALEDLEARRAAIAWLLDAGLLPFLLV